MTRYVVGLLLIVTSVMVSARESPGSAQAQAPVMTNLQVLPKDTPPADVMTRMNIMVEALGVECGYCHQGTDYASDARPVKAIARAMMRWDHEINEALPVVVGKTVDQVTRVRCITCHRGAPIPVTPPSPLRP